MIERKGQESLQWTWVSMVDGENLPYSAWMFTLSCSFSVIAQRWLFMTMWKLSLASHALPYKCGRMWRGCGRQSTHLLRATLGVDMTTSHADHQIYHIHSQHTREKPRLTQSQWHHEETMKTLKQIQQTKVLNKEYNWWANWRMTNQKFEHDTKYIQNCIYRGVYSLFWERLPSPMQDAFALKGVLTKEQLWVAFGEDSCSVRVARSFLTLD